MALHHFRDVGVKLTQLSAPKNVTFGFRERNVVPPIDEPFDIARYYGHNILQCVLVLATIATCIRVDRAANHGDDVFER